MTAHDDIQRVLASLDLFTMSPTEQDEIAAKVVRIGLQAADIATIYRFTQGRADLTGRMTKAQVAKALRSEEGPGLRRILDSARAWEAQRDREDADEQLWDADRKRQGSHRGFCRDGNPYGWKMQEHNRLADHDIPGEWNPYRQCYNLTGEERRKAGARDHKRRGCSRWEVLGNADHKAPAIEWDQAEADTIKGRTDGASPINGGEEWAELTEGVYE